MRVTTRPDPHGLVSLDTWPDTTVDGLPIVSALFVCACGDRRWSQTPGRTVPEARANAERWHEVHRRVEAGRWPPLYARLRRLPPIPFMRDFPFLPTRPVLAEDLALLAVEAGDPGYARTVGVL